MDLRIAHTLPRGWTVNLAEPVHGTVLKPGESRRVHAIIQVPASQGTAIEAPFDGRIKGTMAGAHAGPFTGNLTQGRTAGGVFTARVSALGRDGALVTGTMTGTLDVTTARFKGAVGNVQLEGCLRPDRIVNIGQYYKGEALGGLSLQVQVPLPAGSCFEALPPTDTKATPTGAPGRPCLDDAKALIECIDLSKKRVCTVNVKSVLVEVKFKTEDDCD